MRSWPWLGSVRVPALVLRRRPPVAGRLSFADAGAPADAINPTPGIIFMSRPEPVDHPLGPVAYSIETLSSRERVPSTRSRPRPPTILGGTTHGGLSVVRGLRSEHRRVPVPKG